MEAIFQIRIMYTDKKKERKLYDTIKILLGEVLNHDLG
jgi:hypothetical protein